MDKQPSIVLSYDPKGPKFPISEQCEMPRIKVTATLQNITPDPKIPLQYQWKVTLVFSGQGCVHSGSRVIKHPEINQTTATNQFTIPFSKVRGGDLTVNVTIRVGTVTLTAQSDKLQVTGTNPSVQALRSEVPANDGFRKLIRLESSLLQFRSDTCPLFSADGKGGVGLCQLTSPAPTDDQVWSWKENVSGGWQLFHGKESIARKYPDHVRKSAEFQALVKVFNDQRAAKNKPAPGTPGGQSPAAKDAGLKPLTVELPDYTAEQLERDTLRGFNGYAGGLHEYRVKVDKDGVLVVTADQSGTRGTAEWELMSAADRTAYYDKVGLAQNNRGDPKYVDDVEKQASF